MRAKPSLPPRQARLATLQSLPRMAPSHFPHHYVTPRLGLRLLTLIFPFDISLVPIRIKSWINKKCMGVALGNLGNQLNLVCSVINSTDQTTTETKHVFNVKILTCSKILNPFLIESTSNYRKECTSYWKRRLKSCYNKHDISLKHKTIFFNGYDTANKSQPTTL